jgi:hypothetical protein
MNFSIGKYLVISIASMWFAHEIRIGSKVNKAIDANWYWYFVLLFCHTLWMILRHIKGELQLFLVLGENSSPRGVFPLGKSILLTCHQRRKYPQISKAYDDEQS